LSAVKDYKSLANSSCVSAVPYSKQPIRIGKLQLAALVCLAALCVRGTIAHAQVLAEAGDAQAEEQVEVVRLHVWPAAEPKPALKYRFLVAPVDQIHGNAATYVYKSMIFEGPDLLRELAKFDDSNELGGWLEAPLGELPQAEILGKAHWLSSRYPWQSLLDAARCDHCDWGDPIREEGADTVLPQTQRMRDIGRGIALKTRLLIAQGNYDEAVDTLRVGYALTRNLGHGTCLVQCLVGMAIEGILNQQTRTIIEAENSPNLYWALTDLARRPVDMREALSYEAHMWEFTVHELADFERTPLTNEEAARLADKVWAAVGKMRMGNRGKPAKGPAEIILWATELFPEAKGYLLEHGYTAEALDEFPALQVVLIYRWKQYLELRDDYFKWGYLPDTQARVATTLGHGAAEKQIEQGVGGPFSQRGIPFNEALAGLRGPFVTQLKYRRQIGLLRTIEALRMYAAEHGRFPEKLEDVTAVPIPRDPFTDKPFEYSGSGGVAFLSTPHDETWTVKAGAIRYEIELRRPAKEDDAKK